MDVAFSVNGHSFIHVVILSKGCTLMLVGSNAEGWVCCHDARCFRLSDTNVWEKCRLTAQMEDSNRFGKNEGGSHPDKWCSILGSLWCSVSSLGSFLSLVFAARPAGLSVSSNEISKHWKGFSSSSALLTIAAWDVWDTFTIQCSRIYACVVLKMHTHSLYSQPDLSISKYWQSW